MAINVICSGADGPSVTWQIVWDDVNQSIDLTINGHATAFFVEVVGLGFDVLADCVNGPASGTSTKNGDGEDVFKLGNIMGAGQTVVVGPGSIIGKTAHITSIAKTALFAIGTRWTP
jgi:hypothetical protein